MKIFAGSFLCLFISSRLSNDTKDLFTYCYWITTSVLILQEWLASVLSSAVTHLLVKLFLSCILLKLYLNLSASGHWNAVWTMATGYEATKCLKLFLLQANPQTVLTEELQKTHVFPALDWVLLKSFLEFEDVLVKSGPKWVWVLNQAKRQTFCIYIRSVSGATSIVVRWRALLCGE